MKKTIYPIALLILSFTVFSCSDDDEFTPGVFVEAEKELFESDRIYVRYQENEEQVKLIIEDLLNISDNREGEFTVLDFLVVRVDVNNNNIPDNFVDKSYGKSQSGTPCMQLVLEGGSASTGCTQEEGYTYKSTFEISDKLDMKHIIYELVINKDNVFENTGTIGLIFVMNGEDSGGSVPFLLSPLFSETIEFSL